MAKALWRHWRQGGTSVPVAPDGQQAESSIFAVRIAISGTGKRRQQVGKGTLRWWQAVSTRISMENQAAKGRAHAVGDGENLVLAGEHTGKSGEIPWAAG